MRRTSPRRPVTIVKYAPKALLTSLVVAFALPLVTAFDQSLRGGKYLEGFCLEDSAELARGARGEDAYGYRGEFLRLVQLARRLQPDNPGQCSD